MAGALEEGLRSRDSLWIQSGVRGDSVVGSLSSRAGQREAGAVTGNAATGARVGQERGHVGYFVDGTVTWLL